MTTSFSAPTCSTGRMHAREHRPTLQSHALTRTHAHHHKLLSTIPENYSPRFFLSDSVHDHTRHSKMAPPGPCRAAAVALLMTTVTTTTAVFIRSISVGLPGFVRHIGWAQSLLHETHLCPCYRCQKRRTHGVRVRQEVMPQRECLL